MEWDNWPIYPCIGCGETHDCKSNCPAHHCGKSLAFRPEDIKQDGAKGHCQVCGKEVSFSRVQV